MSEIYPEQTVFILGAGATRAFLPAAPLIEDDYDLNHLLDIFRGFPHAFEILQVEVDKSEHGRINIERLMTRLQGRMPYDTEELSHQHNLLLAELKRTFVRKINVAKAGTWKKEELAAFARACVTRRITCITFNYDDALDQALWEVRSNYGRQMNEKSEPYWHPDGGYGFFVRPSEVTIRDSNYYMDKTSMLLLKLHGSINWYAKMGEKRPYGIDAILHRQSWYPPSYSIIESPDAELVARHLESEPFIIPPVLDKSVLVYEPVLQTVWSLAKERLQNAKKIVFVGYSLPLTDLAAAFLFSEALRNRTHIISVVSLASKDDEKEALYAAYGRVFTKIKKDQFDFSGALQWAINLVEGARKASGTVSA